MRHGAETARVKIPPHILHRDIHLLDAANQLVVVLLTLGTADNLADSREKHIHGTHGLPVIVKLHIESLDFLGIPRKDYRTLEMLFNQEALMLALEVDTHFTGNSNL